MDRANAVTLVALALVSACVGDHPTQVTETASVKAAITVEPALVTPSQSTIVTCTATVPRTLMLSQASLRIEGFGHDTTLGLGPYSVGNQLWRLQLHIPTGPIEGEMHFRLVAKLQDLADSADATLRIKDDGPPRLLVQMPADVQPPDSLRLVLDAEDAAGITDIVVHVRGAAFRDIARQYDYERTANLTETLWLPLSTRLGDSIVVTAETHDGFGHPASQYKRAQTVDLRNPSVTVHVDTVRHTTPIDMSFYPLLFFPGDPVHIHISGSDNHGLAWVGFEYLGARDSVATDSLVADADFGMEVPTGANTDAPISAFARDRAGNRSTAWVSAVAMDGQYRTISDQLQHYGPPTVTALDERNDILYFVGDSSRSLYRLGLTPLTPMGPVFFDRPTVSVGLSPGQDTVWVLLPVYGPWVGDPNLLVGWNIAAGPSSMDTIRISGPVGCYAHSMRITVNRHAVVTRWPASCGAVDVDLASKTLTPLSLWPGLLELAGTSDLKTVVAWDDRYYQVYLPETGFVGPPRQVYDGYNGYPNQEPAFDRPGTDILLRNRLYDHLFTGFRWLGPDQRDLPGTQALSWDNSAAFVGSLPGYWRFDVASGAEIERVILPRRPDKLIAHPDGQRLIVFGSSWVGVVDLR